MMGLPASRHAGRLASKPRPRSQRREGYLPDDEGSLAVSLPEFQGEGSLCPCVRCHYLDPDAPLLPRGDRLGWPEGCLQLLPLGSDQYRAFWCPRLRRIRVLQPQLDRNSARSTKRRHLPWLEGVALALGDE